jgi:methyl-accepting chemotaxis protein
MKEVDALIHVVLAESEQAMRLMDESTREAEAGARMAEQSAKAMASVTGVVRGSGELLAETAGVASAQAKSVEAALQALQVITGVAREAEQSGRIAVRTSEQVNRACEQLKEAMAQFRADSAGAGPTLAADSSMAAAAGRRS